MVIPHLTVKDGARAIEYYKKVFGATEASRHLTPDGKIMHATLRFGAGTVFLNDEYPEMGCVAPTQSATPVMMMIYVPDVDATFKRSVDAGAQVKMPVSDQFWGDRYGMLVDPFGHFWEIATHKEDLSMEEMERRGREAMSQPNKK